VNRHLRNAIGVAATFILILQVCPVARSQEAPPPTAPPSLGDVARKNREEKAAREKNNPSTKTTFTNDDLFSGKGGGLYGVGAAPSGSSAGPLGYADAMASLNFALRALDMLDGIDSATLIKNATNGNTADFPGRREWEARLVSARRYYVDHGREMMNGLKSLMLEAKTLHDTQPDLPESDPRVQALEAKLKAANIEATKVANDFRTLIQEGRDKATQASAH